MNSTPRTLPQFAPATPSWDGIKATDKTWFHAYGGGEYLGAFRTLATAETVARGVGGAWRVERHEGAEVVSTWRPIGGGR